MRLFVASAQSPGEQGHTYCTAISTPDLRGECTAMNAAHHGRQHPQDARPAQWCEGIQSPLWKEACWPLLADARGLTGPAAIAACQRTTRFQPHCLTAALERALDTVVLPREIGQEDALTSAIETIVSAYESHAPAAHQRHVYQSLAAQQIAHRWANRPFSVELCGQAEPELCQLAYRISILERTSANDIQKICGQGHPWALSPSAAGAIPLGAWQALCTEAAHRQAWQRGQRDGPPPPVPPMLRRQPDQRPQTP